MSETYISDKNYEGEDLRNYGDFLRNSLALMQGFKQVKMNRNDGVIDSAVLEKDDTSVSLSLKDGTYRLVVRGGKSKLNTWLGNGGFRLSFAEKEEGWFDDPEASGEREFDGYEWKRVERLDPKVATRMNYADVTGIKKPKEYVVGMPTCGVDSVVRDVVDTSQAATKGLGAIVSKFEESPALTTLRKRTLGLFGYKV